LGIERANLGTATAPPSGRARRVCPAGYTTDDRQVVIFDPAGPYLAADPFASRRCRSRCAGGGGLGADWDSRDLARGILVLPLSDGVPARRFPIVNVSLIVANFAVWICYELPNLNSAIYHASFYPCTVDDACRGAPEPWGVSWITAMFLHGSWDHILGNMLFLAIFGKNVEDAFGPVRYLVFYFAGGFVAMMTQTGVTLLFGTAADGQVPNLGASGAIAAVLGAYFVLYPRSQILTWIVFVVIRVPAWVYLGLWFLYQLIEANFGLFSTSANGGGVAFFAHVGGFLFGVLVAWLLARAGRITAQAR
jgi:membrane associated rhomboid family serine protease